MSDIDALRKQLLVTEHVNVAGGAGFEVAGVSLDSILRIFRRHKEPMRELFDQVVAGADGGPGLSLDSVGEIGRELLSSAPRIAAELIAEAAGYTDQAAVDLFLRLPVATQLDALEKIGSLTFTEEMPPKKVLETVARLLSGVSQTLIGSVPA